MAGKKLKYRSHVFPGGKNHWHRPDFMLYFIHFGDTLFKTGFISNLILADF